MTKESLKDSLWDLDFTSEMNVSYYKHQMQKYGWWDKFTKIAIAVLAVLSLAFSLLAMSSSVATWVTYGSVAVSFAALVAAIWLNISPVDELEREFRGKYIQWTQLLGDVHKLELDAFGTILSANFLIETKGTLTDDMTKPIEKSFAQLHSRVAILEADERTEDKKLSLECYFDENQRRWGVRTDEEVHAEMERRMRKRAVEPAIAEMEPA